MRFDLVVLEVVDRIKGKCWRTSWAWSWVISLDPQDPGLEQRGAHVLHALLILLLIVPSGCPKDSATST